jgi:putative YhdH/YhfP family quinone oxidoreductase
MAIGTAGYTAMLAVNALEEAGLGHGGAKGSSREVVVTGAAGGVGSTAVVLLAELGHRVVAVTGRPDTHDYLRSLGASDFIDRAAFLEKGAVLQKERWAGGVDSVGGVTLANVLAQTAYGGAVAACGLAGGTDLPSSVHPFILRGVSLLGIDSVMAPMPKRLKAWKRLAEVLPKAKLAAMTTIEPMSKLPELAKLILEGKIRGRVVIDVNA